MINFSYRHLKVEDCDRINEMDPTHFIKRAWREVNGKRQLVEINYHDLDWPNGYEYHLEELKKTILSGGVAIGAFNADNKLIGFVSINREVIGEKFKHVLLDQLFVSLEERNKGIGKTLFNLSVEVARKWNVDKLYICAGSAEDTIAFYFSIGCCEAEEIIQELYESDPRDYQLEYKL